MIKILVIADDFTGALDSGVKFSAAGASTKLTLDPDIDFSAVSCEVLVLCAPTRHLPPQDAYRMLLPVAKRAAAAQIPCIMKKTDSALRGNIGAELQAILDGTAQQTVHFVPAFPAMNRTTNGGTHYIENIPVAQSVFGQDPFDPVTESHVPTLLATQCTAPVTSVPTGEFSDTLDGIAVYDCTSSSEMDAIAARLFRTQPLLVAGCAGLAGSLPPHLGLSALQSPPAPTIGGPLAVICGSLNPISQKQLHRGETAGYPRIHLSSALLTASQDTWEQNRTTLLAVLQNTAAPRFIIDSLPDGDTPSQPCTTARDTIAHRIGTLLKDLLDNGLNRRILIIGGDTLLAFLEALNCHEITPICELQQGVVLSRIVYQGKHWEIVSKSGGFGSEDLLLHL